MVTQTYTSNGSWSNLFNDPFFIGVKKDFEKLAKIHSTSINSAYPPYNVIKHDEDTYTIEIAVAGFSKDDIDIKVEDHTLYIKGEVSADDTEGEYVYRGIAARKFTRAFALGEYIEIGGAEMKDGLLIVSLDKIVPDEKKPKTIKIK